MGHFIYLELYGFFKNKNMEILQMILLALVANIEFELNLRALETSVIN